MELYVLDNLYRRTDVVIDKYESLIWKERFAAYGDFELKVHSTLENRNRFKAGTRLAMSESTRVMTVETVEDASDDQGKRLLKLKGRSLEYILDSRLARGTLGNLTATPKWVITDPPADIARKIFHDICVTGILDPGDIISGVNESSIYPEDTVDEPTDEVTYEIDMVSVYKAIVDLCDVYGMGFRLIRNHDNNQLYFDVYMGSDRTTSQTALPAVIFSPDFDNLKSTTKLDTTVFYKNVAYVISPVGSEVVYGIGIDPDIEGFERKVMFIKADDITDTTPGVASAQMIRRGEQELAKARNFTGLDGEVGQNTQFVYERDHYLGDLVELRDEDGQTSNMQVTEQIFVSDKEGKRSYPTLTIKAFVTPGSWLAAGLVEWADKGAIEWEDEP